MAVHKRKPTNRVRDKKTGRMRAKDRKHVMAGRKAARRRRGKHLKATTRRAISKGVRKAIRTHKTKAGRRVVARKKSSGSPKMVVHRTSSRRH